jgi:hypothetical protein
MVCVFRRTKLRYRRALKANCQSPATRQTMKPKLRWKDGGSEPVLGFSESKVASQD